MPYLRIVVLISQRFFFGGSAMSLSFKRLIIKT